MLQCKDCEFFTRDTMGRIILRCDPFSTIKEPSCLDKWQLVRLDALLQSYQATLRWYQKLAPMQEQMFEYMKREMDEMEDADGWKYQEDDMEADTEDENDKEDENPFQ
jgi:E3 ubiquitin-protein ligase DOA10